MVGVIYKETYNREFQKDFANFLNYSRGSAMEVQSHQYVELDLKYIDTDTFTKICLEYNEISRMITSFQNYLRNPKSNV